VYYDGTVVCVLNESGDLLDIASVNEKGEFYLYDFLYFRLSLPGKSSGIASQTIYINEKMEVIETINKRPAGGHFVYVLNSKENQANKAVVKIFTTKENAVLFSSVYFDEGRPSITVSGCKELGKVVAYLNDHPSSNVYLLAHASSMGTPGFNKQLTQKRADATANYLTAKGINGNRIKIKGNRKNRAVRTVEITPGSAEEDQKNRRVDVYIKIQ
jgi:outer membrane protein OmpA-like peptidoglycan-associated protein